MNRAEAIAGFDELSNYLAEKGFNWVVRQVQEELVAGRLREEKVATLSESIDEANLSVVDRRLKRGQTAEFVTRDEYSRQEAFALLVQAARRAICDPVVIAAELQQALNSESLGRVLFVAEDGEEILSLERSTKVETSEVRGFCERLEEVVSAVGVGDAD